MRGKRLQYILFPIVAGIWLFAIYKYFIEEPGGNDAPAPVISQDFQEADTSPHDQPVTFGLLGGYRDPFLGKERFVPPPPLSGTSSPKAPRISPSQKTANSETAATGPNWKRFRYLGLVRESGTDEPYAILSIDGRAQTLPAGGSANGVTVKSLAQDSVVIVFQNVEQKLGR